MKSITQSYVIHASISEVWNGLVNEEYINSWGGGPAKMNKIPEGKFFLWGGSIWGINKKVEKNKSLIQEWYSESKNRKWDKPSIVTFSIRQDGNNVKVELHQTNIPDDDVKSIDSGWKEYYLGPMKEYLESK
jgi:activator of HSP90 ATPase